jgi:hypothetical protein
MSFRRLYHKKSNKYDACTDELQAVKRLDDLQDFDRKPRSYKQQDASYWNNRREAKTTVA